MLGSTHWTGFSPPTEALEMLWRFSLERRPTVWVPSARPCGPAPAPQIGTDSAGRHVVQYECVPTPRLASESSAEV